MDDAIECAKRAVDERDPLLFYLKVHPMFDALRADPEGYGQLGERNAAGEALREVLALKPDFAEIARNQFGTWYLPQLVEQLVDGLRKAGLEIPRPAAATARATPTDERRRPAAETAAISPRDSAVVAIAVLPFADMSASKDQDYLCEGMAEEIMNALVRVDGIRVASRTAAFRARRDGGDLPSIARTLSVGHVLEGSVRAAGTRLRVTAQLTDAGTGYQLWSERFDRELEDVFAVQDEIAAGVVEAVKARLVLGARTVHARPHARNFEAYRSSTRPSRSSRGQRTRTSSSSTTPGCPASIRCAPTRGSKRCWRGWGSPRGERMIGRSLAHYRMQLVEGEPLDRLIPAGGLPVDRLLEIATALAGVRVGW